MSTDTEDIDREKVDCPFNPFDSKTIQNPYPYFTWLRDNRPVCQVGDAGYYAVSRYKDISTICRNHQDYSSHVSAFLFRDSQGKTKLADAGDGLPTGPVLGAVDPPDHNRQRMHLRRSMAPRVEQMEQWIRHRANQLMDGFLETGRVELISQYAQVIPSESIVQLLGLPMIDVAQIGEWSSLSAQLISGVSQEEELVAGGDAVMACHAYLEEQFKIALADQPDSLIGDLAKLVNDTEVDFHENEALGILFQLIVGGHETTSATIGAAIHFSQVVPGIFMQIQDNYDLIPDYLEEVLRLETPAQGSYRVTTRDTTLSGVLIPKGSTVMLLWGAANRDESIFSQPDQFQLSRPNIKNHISFGQGVHFCVGAILARLEARIALEVFIERTRHCEYHFTDTAMVYDQCLFIRRLSELNITFVNSGA